MKQYLTPIIDVKKYGGKQVAIVGGKIVASGNNAREVLAKARKKLPHTTWRDILLVTVPKSLYVVYKLWAGLSRLTESGFSRTAGWNYFLPLKLRF